MTQLGPLFNPTLGLVPFATVNNGIADATPAIAAAIATAPAGGVIFFPAGIYLITSTLVIATPKLRFEGLGRGSIIRAASPTFHMFDIRADDVAFEDLAFEGASQAWAIQSIANGPLICTVTLATAHGYAVGATFQITIYDTMGTTTGIYRGVGQSWIATSTGATTFTIPTTGVLNSPSYVVLSDGFSRFAIYTNPLNATPARVRVTECYFGGPSTSVGLNSALWINTCSDWLVEECTFGTLVGSSGLLGFGYGVLGSTATRLTALNNKFFGIVATSTQAPYGRHAVYLTVGANYAEISGNSVDAFNEDAFPQSSYLTQPACVGNVYESNLVTNRAIGSSGSGAFSANGRVQNCKWLQNVVVNDGGTAFYIQDGDVGGYATDFEISDNVVDGCGLNGITLQGAKRVYGENNIVIDPSGNSHGTYASLNIIAQGTGAINVQPENICVGVRTETKRQFRAGQATIASPSQITTWGVGLVPVASVVGTAGTCVVTTKFAHGFQSGQQFALYNVAGYPEANGEWTITAVTATTISFAIGTNATATPNTGSCIGPAAHGFITGDAVQITEAAPITGVNGGFLVTKVDDWNITLNGSIGAGSTTKAVTGTSNAGGLIKLAFATAHGFVSGETLVVTGTGGTLEANGVWTCTVVDATHVTLDGSTFANAWTAGGTARSLGQLLAPTARAWMYVNVTAPQPRGIAVGRTTGGVICYGPTDVQFNGAVIDGIGPVWAKSSATYVQGPLASGGDIRLHDNFEIRAALRTTGGDLRVLRKDGSGDTIYIGDAGADGGCYVEQSASGFFRVLIASAGTVLSATAAGVALGIDASSQATLNNVVQTTVGAAGGASALPLTPAGYLRITINGTVQLIPYYNN